VSKFITSGFIKNDGSNAMTGQLNVPSISANYIQINTAASFTSGFTPSAGTISWNSDDKTMNIGLENGSSIQLPLAKYGENSFTVYVFDNMGKSISLPDNRIIISRTAASIDAIPASSSIGLEVKDKVGGKLVLDYLVKEGDKLPAKGERIYKAGESLKAGSNNSIKFKLWEGEISDTVTVLISLSKKYFIGFITSLKALSLIVLLSLLIANR
jgi:hypothetical protein